MIAFSSGKALGGSLALLLLSGLVSALSGFGLGCQGTSADEPGIDIDDDLGSSTEPRLSATFHTAEDLARTIVAAIARDDEETLKRLPLSKDEFRIFVWPELPSSRPGRGVPLEYAWGELSQKSRAALAQTFARYKGRHIEFLAIDFEGETTDYETYKVHRDARVQVRLDDDRKVWLDLFGSVMERRGKYKLFSYVTD